MAAMRVRQREQARYARHSRRISSWISHFRSGLRRFLPGHRAGSERPPFRRKMLFEALEPRILLSGEVPTISWVGTANGFWDVAANWQDSNGVARLPNSTDDVLIDVASANPTITVRSAAQPAAAHSLVTNESFVLASGGVLNMGGDLTVQNGNTFQLGGKIAGGNITAGATLTATGGNGTLDHVTLGGTVVAQNFSSVNVTGGLTFTSGGVIQVGAGGAYSGSLAVFSGDQTVSGPGEIRMLGGRLLGSADQITIQGNVTLGTGVIVRAGSENIAINSGASLVNQGSIIVRNGQLNIAFSGRNWSNAAGGVLDVDAGTLALDGNWSNAGEIKLGATAGTALFLGGSFTTAGVGTITRNGTVNNFINVSGLLDNSGATLALNATTGSWNLRGGTIKGGRLTTADGVQLYDSTSGGVLDGISLAGTIMAVRLSVTHGMTLEPGSLFLVGGTPPTTGVTLWGDLTFNGTQTIGGTGEIRFVGPRSFGSAGDMRINGGNVTFGPGLAIDGDAADFIIQSGATLTHQSTFAVTGGSGFRFGLGSGTFVNEGSLLFTNASVGLGAANVILAPGSVLRDPGGAITVTGTLDNTGKTLTLDASLGTFALADNGTIKAGTLVTTGAFDLGVFHGVGFLDGVTLRGTANLSVPFSGNVVLRAVNGLTLDSGLIKIGNGGNLSFAGTQTLGGTGSVLFTDSNVLSNMTVLTAGTTLTIAPGITVHGNTGKINATGAAFLNQGTIAADGGGTITAINPGNVSSGVLTGGTWQAIGANSVLRLSGAQVTTNAADVLADGVGAVVSDDSDPLHGLAGLTANTASGKLTLRNGAAMAVPGNLANAGNVTVGAGSSLYQGSTEFANAVIGFSSQFGTGSWSAAQALGAPNTVSYADATTAWAPAAKNGTTEFITVGFATPIFASGVTVRETWGNGFVTKIDVLDTSDVLHTVWTGTDPSQPGTPVNFNATWATTPYLVKGVKVYVDTNHNAGTWEEIDSIQLQGIVGLGAYTQTGGTTVLDAGRLAFSQSVDVLGGALTGPGTVEANLFNAASVDPGSPTGILNVTGAYSQSSTGVLTVDIGGTTAGAQYDRLHVTGNAALNGTLDVNLANGFGPAFGESFQVLDYGAFTGSFTTISGLKVGFKPIFTVDQNGSRLQLNAIANASDLAFNSMTIPADGGPGKDLTVSYTVKNLQSTEASGDWYDSIYLSPSPVMDSGAQLLGRVHHTGDVAGNATYTETLTAPTPNLAAGNYHVIVLVDSKGSIPDLNRANNTGVSSGVVTVSVPVLTLGAQAVSGTIKEGQDIYYRMVVPPGQDVDITASFGVAKQAEFYVRYGALPDRSNFDLMAEDLSILLPRLSIANAQGGDYYILLHGREGAAFGSGGVYTLQADAAAFGITKFTPDKGSNEGNVTVTVSGTLFTDQTTITLTDVSGRVVSTADVTFVESKRLNATFHLGDDHVEKAFYNLRATDHGQTVTAAGLFDAGAGIDGFVSLNILAPAVVRVGMPISVTIKINNGGGSNAVAPIIEVRASNVAENEKKKQFFGNEDEETLPGTLPPGEGNDIGIMYTPQPKAVGVTSGFDLLVVNPSTVLIDWDSQKESYRPSYVSPAAWDAIWSNFRPRVGNTVADFYALLMEDSKELARNSHDGTRGIHELMRFEFEKAADDMPALPLVTATDFVLPGQGFDLGYGRSYGASLFDRFRPGRLGIGWSDSYDISATVDNDGLVSIRAGTTMRFFGKLENGSYLGFPGEVGTLTEVGGGLRLREIDGSVTQFRSDGLLDYKQDANGNRVTAAYSGKRLVSVTHSDGAALTFTYNTAGFVSKVTDTTGREATYSYDSVGHLLSVTTAQGATAYTYTSETSGPRAHAIASVTSSAGTHTFYTYDTQGRLARQEADGGAQALNYIYGTTGYSVTDALGRISSVSFDHSGMPVALAAPLSPSSQSTYDGLHNLVTVKLDEGGGISSAYDDLHNPTAVVNRLGESQSFTYQPGTDRLTGWTDALGNATVYSSDANGNLRTITYADGSRDQFSYDARGNLTQSISRNGQAITYTYDTHGLLLRKGFADGSHADYTYDARGNMTSAADANGTTTLQYDTADRLKKITYPSGRFLEYTYDAAGRRTRITDQSGFAENYTYDTVGRLAGVTDAGGNLVVRYTYDAAGLLIREDKGNGTYTTYEYDAAGRLAHLVHLAPDNSVQSRFDYTYDSLGRQDSVTTLEGTTAYAFDGVGRLTGATLPGGRTISYQYDAAGNRTVVSDSGATINYVANGLNQYTAIGGAGYSYDLNGSLTAGGGNSLAYDSEGRLTGVTGADGTWTYQYDALGNRIAATHNGQTVQFLVDPTGMGSVFGEYDANGQIVAHYTQGIGLESRVDASGVAAYYDFDSTGSTRQLTGGGGTVLNTYRYLPFGETLNTQESVANPFSYVGQWGVMEEGGGLFYMRARSYDPAQGRFVEPDPVGLLGGVNAYAYARNNPVQVIDPVGLGPDDTIVDPNMAFNVGLTIFGPEYEAGIWAAGEREAIDVQAARDFARGIIQTGGLTGFLAVARASSLSNALNLFGETFLGEAVEGGLYTVLAAEIAAIAASLGSIGYAEYLGHLPQCNDDFGALNAFLACDGPPTWADNAIRSIAKVFTTQIGPHDPNELFGPGGFGPEEFIQSDLLFPYQVYFENDPKATAPAQNVVVTEQLDSDLDWSTFEFGDFGWGGVVVDVPEGRQFYSTRVDLSATTGLFVDVEAAFDPVTGVAKWTFLSLDPATLDTPMDPLAGFLPPDGDGKIGQGFAGYFVKPKQNKPTGTVVTAQASVVFDTEAPIATPMWSNTIDADGPSSSVDALPSITTTADFTVNWSGADDAGGSGIASFDIYGSIDGAAYALWQDHTTDTSAAYSGTTGHTYAFYSAAEDNVGHVEAAPATADASIQVVNANQAPVAVDDILAATEDTPVTYTAAQLLGNDTDVDGPALSIAGVTSGTGGTVVLNANGSVTFTPAANLNGAASFSYIATDGTLGSNSAGVTVNVAAVNDAPVAVADILAATEDTPITYTAAQLLGNDTDVDGPALSIASVAIGTGGSVVLNANGSVTFTPTVNVNGAASFSYIATDGVLGSNSASVTVNVAAVNDAPVLDAIGDRTVDEGQKLSFQAVASDVDTPAGLLSFSLDVGAPAGAAIAPDGLFTWTPTAAQGPGLYPITIRVDDGELSDFETFSVAVNAVSQATASIVGRKFEDSDGDGVRAAGESGLSGWTIYLDADNDGTPDAGESFAVTDAGGSYGFSGLAAGSYVVREVAQPGWAQTQPAAGSWTIALLAGETRTDADFGNRNVAPQARDDAYQVAEDGVLTVPAAQGVLANDFDTEVLTLSLDSGPAHGSLDVHVDGGFVYTPAENYFGPDTFTYRVTDGHGSNSDEAQVAIDVTPVNDVPMAVDDTLAATEDTPITYTAAQLLGNDTDVDSATLSIASVTSSAGGTVALNAGGTVTFTPAANFNGAASFSYIATDGLLNSNSANVTVNVAAVNDAPVANNDAYAVNENTTLTVSAPGPLGNDTDVENATLAAFLVNTTVNGTLTPNSDGSFTYAPHSHFNGSDSFTYRANDGQTDSGIATVLITVSPINDAPVANDDTLAATEDTPITYTAAQLLGNDTDVDGPALSVASVTSGTGGGVVLNANGTVTFTPSENFNGAASFSYIATDGALNSSSANVAVNVAEVNDAPSFTSTPITLLTVAPQIDGTQDRAFHSGGPAGTSPEVVFTVASKDSTKYDAGYYRVDDASGRIGNLKPGDAGYLEAALAAGRAVTLFNSTVVAGAERRVNLPTDTYYGYYLIVSPKKVGTPGQAPAGTAPYGANVFFSFEGANPEAWDGLHTQVVGDTLQLKWESGVHGGDGSYDNFVMSARGLAIPSGGGQGAYAYTAQAQDVDGDGLTYGLISAPAGATIDLHTGQLAFQAAIGHYDFKVGADDGLGGHAEQAFQLDVVAPNAVTALAATPTGFRARFDHTFDSTNPNLYQAADLPSLGTPDVLLMSAGMPVPGTLILDDDHAGFSFVKSGSALANGGYTVTLRSGSNAFGGLDGNGDGTPGDDYAGSLTVNNGSTLARVGINDATRGPGQAIDGALAVTLTSNPGANVISVKFSVQYDPALLALTGADLAAGLPAGSKVVASFTTPGLARFTVSSPTAMAAGTIKLVNLKGIVPTNAPYGAKQILDVIDVAINSTQPALDDDGVHVVAFVGDASGNAQYTTLDVQRIERVATGQDSGFSAWRNVAPGLIADVNADGTVALADRDIVNQELQFLINPATGVDRPEIPAIPAGTGPIAFSGPDPLVAIPDRTAQAGETSIVPVYLDTAQGLESVQLTLGYDPQVLEVIAVRPGTLTREFPYFIERHDGGTVYTDLSGPALTGGAGSLIELEVRLKDNATGTLALDLQSAALNEGHLTIGQPPKAGADPTDGRIVLMEAGAAAISNDIESAPTFFDGLNARLGTLVRQIAQLFDSEAEIEPVPPQSRVSDPRPTAAARSPVIDLTGRLASFTLGGNDAVAGQLKDAQRWKRELADGSAGADSAADPNSRLRIPVGTETRRPVTLA